MPAARPSMSACPSPTSAHVKIPNGLTDEQVLFLGDIFPTGWQAAVQCDIEPTDTVAIWGAGPVGQFAIRSAILLGAKQVIAIDRVPERLSMAAAAAPSPSTSRKESVIERLNELTDGKGPEKCIDAVGMEAHATGSHRLHARPRQAGGDAGNRPAACAARDDVCLPARRHALDPRRLWRADRQGAVRHGDEQGPDDPHGPDPRQPLDRRSAAPHPGGPDRPVLRHHAPSALEDGPGVLRDVPRQARRLHQGGAQP